MSLNIPSGRRAFDGFAKFYEASIAPYLAEKERARAKAVSEALIVGAIGGALAIGVLAAAPPLLPRVEIALLIAFGGTTLGALILNRARADITHGLLERIAGKIGFDYEGRCDRPLYYDRFQKLKLLPSHNRETWEDEVSGEYAGSSFVFCEAHLKYKSSGKNRSERTVFHGQLFMIDCPKRFCGETIVLRDRGVVNALFRPGRDFQRVGLASPAFEKSFEAWSTDQVEARDLLDPLVLERFQELERLFGGGKLRAAFCDGKILIVIETGDSLNIGSMFAPFAGGERVEKILREFDAIFDLIDVVLTRVDGRTVGAFTLAAVKAR